MVNRVTLKRWQRLNVNKLGDIYIRSVVIELVVLWENKSTKTFSTRGDWLLLFLGYLMEEIEDLPPTLIYSPRFLNRKDI